METGPWPQPMSNYTATALYLNSLHNHTNQLLWSSSSTVLTVNKPGSLAGNIILTACLTLIFHMYWHLLSKPQNPSHKDRTSYCTPQERGAQRRSLFPHTATGRDVSLLLSLNFEGCHTIHLFSSSISHSRLHSWWWHHLGLKKNLKPIYQTKNVTTNLWLSGPLLFKLMLASNPLFLVRSTAAVKISHPYPQPPPCCIISGILLTLAPSRSYQFHPPSGTSWDIHLNS